MKHTCPLCEYMAETWIDYGNHLRDIHNLVI